MTYKDEGILKLLADPTTVKQGFEIVVNQYSSLLYWKIRHIVIDHDDANDILQNTFVKAWANINEFQNKSKLSTWLYRIAINESLDFVRHRRVVASIASTNDISLADRLMADEYFDADRTQALLQEAISKLPDIQRTVFNLRYYDEMKYSEMSELLDTTEGALKASYHIAVNKIVEFFKKKD